MMNQQNREIEIRNRMRETIVRKSAEVLRHHGLEENQISEMLEEYFPVCDDEEPNFS